MSKPLLSVITVCYNSEKTIRETINSILNQSYSNFEYIVVDGNSKDSTVDLIKSFEVEFQKKGVDFIWISEQDSGIYNAFNKGIKLSSGKWVSFLGSDDTYTPKALEVYAKTISESKEEIDLIYSNVEVKDNQHNTTDTINGKWSWRKFRRYMNIPHVGSFHNKKYFSKYGFFNESYKIAGDYELLLRAKSSLKTIKIDEVTVKMANSGASNNQINLVFKETLKAKNKSGGINLLLCIIDYFIAVFKYFTKKLTSAIIR